MAAIESERERREREERKKKKIPIRNDLITIEQVEEKKKNILRFCFA